MVGCHVEDIPHANNLNGLNSSVRTPLSNDLLPYVSDAAMNPQRLSLINYMTPMAALLNGGPTRYVEATPRLQYQYEVASRCQW